jgi:hypothetical protein
MGGRDLKDLKPVLLACDAAPMRVRRARERLLDFEATAAMPTKAPVAQ